MHIEHPLTFSSNLEQSQSLTSYQYRGTSSKQPMWLSMILSYILFKQTHYSLKMLYK